jgi:hypothetical protein
MKNLLMQTPRTQSKTDVREKPFSPHKAQRTRVKIARYKKRLIVAMY